MTSRKNLITIGKRYAAAAFALAKEAGAEEKVSTELSAVAQAVEEDSALACLLASPLTPREAKLAAVNALTAKLKFSDLTGRILAFLAHAGRLPALPEIARLFAQALSAEKGEVLASIHTPSALSEKERSALEKQLSKAAGKPVQLSAQARPDLLGGYVLSLGNRQLDASIAGKLQRLKLALNASAAS